MRKARKIILYFFLVIISLTIILAVVAALSEDKIARLALDQVAKSTEVPIEVETIDFSLLRNFPNATIRCDNIKIGAFNNSNSKDLASIKTLFVSVESRPLLKRVFNIKKVEVQEVYLNYNVDSAGISNIDFLINSVNQEEVSDSAASNISLDIKEFSLNDIHINYADEGAGTSAKIVINKLELSGLINNESYQGELTALATLSNCNYPGTNINRMGKSNIDIHLNYRDDELDLHKINIAIDNIASAELQGKLNIKDKIIGEISVKTLDLEIEEALQFAPDNLLKNYGISELSGKLLAEAKIQGVLSDSILPAVDLTFDCINGTVAYKNYPKLRGISLTGAATNGIRRNSASSSVKINRLFFRTDSSSVNMYGKIINFERPQYDVDASLDVNLGEIAAFIPDSLLDEIKGKVDLSLSIQGIVPDTISVDYLSTVLKNSTLDLNLVDISVATDSIVRIEGINGKVNYAKDRIDIQNLKTNLPYYNAQLNNLTAALLGDILTPDSMVSLIDTLEVKVGNSGILLNGRVEGYQKPNYSITGHADIDLNDILIYLPEDLLSSLTGKIQADFKSAANIQLDSIETELLELITENSSYDLAFENVSAQLKDSTIQLNNFKGSFSSTDDSLWIESLKMNYEGVEAAINQAEIKNSFQIMVLKQLDTLYVNGDFFIDSFDYAFIDGLTVSDSAESEPADNSIGVPSYYKINGNLAANKIKYEDAVFQDIQSKFLVEPNYYVLDSLKLKAFGGEALSSLKVEMKESEEMELFFRTDVRKMNATSLLDNFGEYLDYEEIKAENVQGTISTRMDGEIVLKDYEPVYESLLLNGNLTVENGALFNVTPVMEIEKIPGIGIKNLDSLYFSKLNSSLFLFKNELYIPRTEIRSTSFDAMFLGMYSFREDYAYHIRMFLGEVLSSKSKANLRKQAEEGGFGGEEEEDEITKGRTSIYLVSKSENGKEKAGFDKKRDRANMSAKVNLQKQMVDMRFHPKLVKYDTEQ